MAKIGIIIPAINCLDYSKKTINSIKTKHDYEIIFIDNGSTDGTKDWLNSRPDIIAYKNPLISSLAGLWNLGIKRAINDGCSLFLVLNNDIILAKNTIDNMVKKIETGKYIMVTGVNDQSVENPDDMMDVEKEYDENEPDNEHPDFSCYMINKAFIEKVGLFDENYRVAYFEDNDTHAKIALSGEKAVSTVSATYYHFCSKTSLNNPHLSEIIGNAFKQNKEYFKEKWGIYPLGDVPNMREQYYKTPFNNPNLTIKDVGRIISQNNIWSSLY
jgi:GT2 family glycosyltransferase